MFGEYSHWNHKGQSEYVQSYYLQIVSGPITFLVLPPGQHSCDRNKNPEEIITKIFMLLGESFLPQQHNAQAWKTAQKGFSFSHEL